MPRFQHDGIEFFYRDTGSGIPFIFQHGLGADSSQPFGLFQPPPGFRLIAFDARAHGQTHPPGDPSRLGFNTFAEDLRALMDHLELEQAIVGGISMGAGITLNFSVRYPERILGLVQSRPAWLESPCPWNVAMFSLVTRLMREHGTRRGQAVFKETAEYRETRETWPDVAESLALQFESPQAEETAFKYERIITDTPWPDRQGWAAIQVPTLVLVNRLDPIHPYEYGEVLARTVAGAELKELTPKSVSLEQHGADVQRYLTAFLAKYF
jgi:pimeloyl-ACP methyl ester carboxylesterase